MQTTCYCKAAKKLIHIYIIISFKEHLLVWKYKINIDFTHINFGMHVDVFKWRKVSIRYNMIGPEISLQIYCRCISGQLMHIVVVPTSALCCCCQLIHFVVCVTDSLQSLSLFMTCLCRDIDHRGYTNRFLVKNASPIVALYSTSAMEHHQFNHQHPASKLHRYCQYSTSGG